MNLFNPDRLIFSCADDPQLVKQLQAGTRKFIWRNRAICIGMPTDGHSSKWRVDYCLFLLLLTGVDINGDNLLLWYLAMMFCTMLLAVNVVHDASHDAFCVVKRPMPGGLTGGLLFLWGKNPDCWRVRHVRSSGFTNIEFYDRRPTAENGFFARRRNAVATFCSPATHRYWPLVAALTFPQYIG